MSLRMTAHRLQQERQQHAAKQHGRRPAQEAHLVCYSHRHLERTYTGGSAPLPLDRRRLAHDVVLPFLLYRMMREVAEVNAVM